MNVLVIGGNRFLGYDLAWRLLAGGHRVTLFNRGRREDPFGGAVVRLRGDRTTADFARVLGTREFDAVVDFAVFEGRDAEEAVRVLSSRVGHYIWISTGQVYLVRAGAPVPAREEDYAGDVLPEPDPATPDHPQWTYGVGKRAAEDAFREAWEERRFPATSLRLPMVNGERDYQRRLESYLWRLLDGGGILLPDGGSRRVRHVYGRDVVRTIVAILGRPATHGRAYNLCQDETPTLADLLLRLAGSLGAPARLVEVPRTEVAAAGLDPVAVSPFSGQWMSFLEASRAKAEIGFQPTPLDHALDTIVASFLAHPPADRPAGYAARAQERALLEGRGWKDAPGAPRPG